MLLEVSTLLQCIFHSHSSRGSALDGIARDSDHIFPQNFGLGSFAVGRNEFCQILPLKFRDFAINGLEAHSSSSCYCSLALTTCL